MSAQDELPKGGWVGNTRNGWRAKMNDVETGFGHLSRESAVETLWKSVGGREEYTTMRAALRFMADVEVRLSEAESGMRFFKDEIQDMIDIAKGAS